MYIYIIIYVLYYVLWLWRRRNAHHVLRSRAFSRAKERWHSLSTPWCFIGCALVYIYINVSCVCVCTWWVEIRVIYIYLGTNHAGEIRSRVFMHNDVVVSDSRHVSRSGLRRDTRQRVKTPVVTRGNSYTSVVLFFIVFSLATCQNRKRRTTQKSDTR